MKVFSLQFFLFQAWAPHHLPITSLSQSSNTDLSTLPHQPLTLRRGHHCCASSSARGEREIRSHKSWTHFCCWDKDEVTKQFSLASTSSMEYKQQVFGLFPGKVKCIWKTGGKPDPFIFLYQCISLVSLQQLPAEQMQSISQNAYSILIPFKFPQLLQWAVSLVYSCLKIPLES